MVLFSHNPDFLQRLSAGRQGEASGLRKKNSYKTDTDIQRRTVGRGNPRNWLGPRGENEMGK